MKKNTKIGLAFLVIAIVLFIGVRWLTSYKMVTRQYETDSQYYINIKGNVVKENPFYLSGQFNAEGIAYVETWIDVRCTTKRVYGFIDEDFDFIDGKYWEEGKGVYTLSDDEDLSTGILVRYSLDNAIIMNTELEELAVVENVESKSITGGMVSDNGYIVMQEKAGLYGYVDKNGKWIIEPQFSFADTFKNGFALVAQNGKYGIIDEVGKWVCEPKYQYMEYGGDYTFYRADIDDETCILVDIYGNSLNDKKYDSNRTSGYFNEGLCAVCEPDMDKVGYIDEKGEYVIEPQFEYAKNFDDGLAPVCKKENGVYKWAYINKDGKNITDYIFDEVTSFTDDGYAAVKVDDKWGYIKRDGSWFLKPQFSHANSFSHGYAAVTLEEGQKILK